MQRVRVRCRCPLVEMLVRGEGPEHSIRMTRDVGLCDGRPSGLCDGRSAQRKGCGWLSGGVSSREVDMIGWRIGGGDT